MTASRDRHLEGAIDLRMLGYRVATDYLVSLQREQDPDDEALLEAIALVLAASVRLMPVERREAALRRTEPELARVVRQVLEAAHWGQ